MEPLELVSNLLNLGWPGIVMWAIYVVWKQYQKRSDELVENLRQELDAAKREKEMLMGVLLDNAKMRLDAARDRAELSDFLGPREGDTGKVPTRSNVGD